MIRGLPFGVLVQTILHTGPLSLRNVGVKYPVHVLPAYTHLHLDIPSILVGVVGILEGMEHLMSNGRHVSQVVSFFFNTCKDGSSQ